MMQTNEINLDNQIAQVQRQIAQLEGELRVWLALREARARVEVPAQDEQVIEQQAQPSA